MKITHDKETGAVYIYLSGEITEGDILKTVGLKAGGNVFADLSPAGRVLGIEARSFKDLAAAIDAVGGGMDMEMLGEMFQYPASNGLHPATALDPCISTLDPGVKSENVDHPAHYGGDGTYEAIRVIEAWGCNFNIGNALKYLCRYREKNGAEDLRKSLWYIGCEIEGIEKMEAGDE